MEILRREQGLTQARLRDIIGGHQSNISKVLAGERGRYLNRDQVLKAARHFHVTVESLLDDQMDLERITEDVRAVTRLVRILGVEESLRRLSLPEARGHGPQETRFAWGHMGREGDGTEDRPGGTNSHIGA